MLAFSQYVKSPIKCKPVSHSFQFKEFQGNYSYKLSGLLMLQSYLLSCMWCGL